jgi:hypothetical protein
VRGLPIPNVSDSLSLYTPKLPVCLEKDQGIFADSYYGLSKGLHAAQRGDAEDERFSNEGLTCSRQLKESFSILRFLRVSFNLSCL